MASSRDPRTNRSMPVLKRLSASTAVLLGWTMCSGAEPVQPIPSDTEIRRILVERIDEEARSIGIVVGVVESGDRRVVSYGRLHAGSESRPNGDTVFEIGSITKVFTSTVLTNFVAQGSLAFETPVQDLLGSDVRVPTRDGSEITLLHLATHSSGLPRLPDNLDPKDPANPYADYTVDQLHAFLASHELTRDIGERVEYSNLGVGLLGHALARRMGTDYETLVSTQLLEPLGMVDTSIALTPLLRDRLAVGHDRALEPAANWDLPTLAGAGALRSTTNDLLTFVEANLDLGDSPLQQAMAETHVTQRPFPAPNMEIGLGWLIRSEHDRQIIWHNGGTGGYRSFIGFDPASRSGVVVLSNTATSVDDLGFHLLDSRFELSTPPPQRTGIEMDPVIYDEYTGRYQLAKGILATVTQENERLFVQLTGQPRLEMIPESETSFFLRAVEAQVSFGRDDRGTVDHLVIHQNGLDQRAVRLAEGVDSVVYGPTETVSVPETTLQRYVGRYALQPGFDITVTLNEGQLWAQVTGQQSIEIFASSETEFFYRVVDARITFFVDGDGSASSLALHQAGRTLSARRLPD